MKSLKQDIETGQFKNVYLLYGEEAYLKKQYRDRLTKAMLPEGDTMNYAHYEGKGIPVPEIIDLAETMPFFAERRLIVIEDSGLFRGSASDLADYIKTMPDTSFLLFVESEVDKRGKLYKAVNSRGRSVAMDRQDERTLTIWIGQQFRKEGKTAQAATIHHLLSKAGTDMQNLEMELEKLFSYTLDQEVITVADVDAVCTTQIQNRIFDMVDMVAKQEKKRALDYYYDLLALKEPPMSILYLLTRQFKLLLEVKSLVRRGYGKKQIAEEAGIHPFVAGKCMDQCRRFQSTQLVGILDQGAELETLVKTGRLNDRMSVEVFILSAAAKNAGMASEIEGKQSTWQE